MTNNTKILVMGDAHVTNGQTLRRFRWARDYIKDSKPGILVVIGDFLTLNSLSAWDMDKRKLMENRRFFKEIEAGNEALDYLAEADVPVKIFLEGNHEDRFTRYLNYRPELLSDDFTIKSLLRLDARGYTWIPYRSYWAHRGVNFTHVPFGKAREISGKDICSKAELVTVESVVFGHCFSWDTEILTPKGWISPNQIDNNTIVGTQNKVTGLLEWEQITGFYEYDHYKELVHFKNNSMDLLVTEDHGMVAESIRGMSLYPKAKDWNFASKAIVSLKPEVVPEGHVNYIPWSDDELRLFVQCVTDGNLDKGKYWKWKLKKQRKIERLESLLTRLGIPYNKREDSAGITCIYVGEMPSVYKKTIPDIFLNLSEKQSEVFLEEWAFTDGTKYGEGTYQLQTSIRKHADFLSALCARNGHKSSLSSNKGMFIVCVRIGVDKTWCSKTQEFNKGLVPYSGRVWCVSVPNGTLLVRRNGKPVVTQNTHELHTSCVHKRGQKHLQQILNVGCFFEKEDDYIDGRMTNYWKGLVELDVYSYGRFDINTVSMGHLRRVYGQ